jgi:hypothetical protein
LSGNSGHWKPRDAFLEPSSEDGLRKPTM